MIPKIIHYCWFGGGEKSAFIKKCISTWEKYLPEYEIKCWSEKNFDVRANAFVEQAYLQKKWAFVSDYARFYVLYKEGGVYMDTDVKLLKPFPDLWFQHGFFSAHEYHPGLFEQEGIKYLNEEFLPIDKEQYIDGFCILSAIMAAKANHPFLKDCLEEYHNMSFLNKEGGMKDTNEVIIAAILGRVAVKYGYRYIDKEQILSEDMLILPSNVLVGNLTLLDNNSYAIHLINGSWLEKKGFDKFMHNIRNNHPKLFPILNIINKIRLKFKGVIKGK
ncbi:glycosyltransferase family 32 protein [Litoribaculum gwangyangense]|uniref:Glycosyltransferase n=1 Tax=Litoribaculum gwangyangense TaxID=1130722 RepID=A0ABP9CRJ7_9FLAO